MSVRILEKNAHASPSSIDWLEFVRLISLAFANASKQSVVHINASRWEELLAASFRRMGHKVHWVHNNHLSGLDLRVEAGTSTLAFSVKAGHITPGGSPPRIKFSSYRTQDSPTLKDKMAFIDNDNTLIDYYLFAAQRENKRRNTREYHIYLVPANFINAKKAVWSVKSNGDAEGKQKNDVVLKVKEKLSSQLWVDLPLTLLNGSLADATHRRKGTLLKLVSIPSDDLGSQVGLLFTRDPAKRVVRYKRGENAR